MPADVEERDSGQYDPAEIGASDDNGTDSDDNHQLATLDSLYLEDNSSISGPSQRFTPGNAEELEPPVLDNPLPPERETHTTEIKRFGPSAIHHHFLSLTFDRLLFERADPVDAEVDDLISGGEPTRFDQGLAEAFLFNSAWQEYEGEDLGDLANKASIQDEILQLDNVREYVEHITDNALYSNEHGLSFLANSIMAYYAEEDLGLFEAFEKAVLDPDLDQALEEIRAIDQAGETATIGIEYEVPVMLGNRLGLGDIVSDEYIWYDSMDHLFVDQENVPYTLEIKTDINGGIKSTVQDIDNRREFVEDLLREQGLRLKRESNGYRKEYPGVHIHIGTDIEDTAVAEEFMERVGEYVPLMTFLSANGEGMHEGMDVLSERQISEDAGRGMDLRYHSVLGTVEYRMPDVYEDSETLETITASYLGLHKYVETELREEIEHGAFTPRELEDSEDAYSRSFRSMDYTTWHYLTGEEEVPDEEINEFVDKVRQGLDSLGTPYVDEYEHNLRELFNRQKKRVDGLNTAV